MRQGRGNLLTLAALDYAGETPAFPPRLGGPSLPPNWAVFFGGVRIDGPSDATLGAAEKVDPGQRNGVHFSNETLCSALVEQMHLAAIN
jgi:hypothetical protein